jgi:plasmid stability protein
MNDTCELFRKNISRALLKDLPSQELDRLNEHLAVCAECASEQELYRHALGEMRQVEDLPVPRHFFVYPEERGLSLWQAYRGLQAAYRWGTAAAFGLLLILAGFSVFPVRLEKSDGRLSISIGRPLASPLIVPPAAQVDVAALRQPLLAALEQRIREERQEWGKQLHAVIARSGRQFSQPQREILQAAMISLEERMDQKISAAGTVLEAKSNQNLQDLYKTLQVQREQDLVGIHRDLNQLVQVGTQKTRQTDAILETLIQVAELRWNTASPKSSQQ